MHRLPIAALALLLLFGAGPASAQAKKGRRMLEAIPVDVREFLTAGDGLGQAAVMERHPNVKQNLKSPETRAALVAYLSSNEPWDNPTPSLTLNALAHIQRGATPEEAEHIRPFLLHDNPWVRLRTYQYLMVLFYPTKERQSMLTLFAGMLLDPDEVVRLQGARLITGTQTEKDLTPFLTRWLQTAKARGWEKLDSYLTVRDLLHKQR